MHQYLIKLKMLEFLRKIFQNDEPEEIKKVMEVELKNLEQWLNERSKPVMEEVQHQAELVLMKVDEEVQKARFNIDVLENAKLQNPNIPFRAKQYMEGNRKAYIKAVNSFLGNMEINNKDYFYLLDFCNLFEEMINSLNKSTLRSYTILQEFFANETSKIAKNLKNFDAFFKELKSALTSDTIVKVNHTRDKIQNLRIRVKQKINLEVDLKDAEASLLLASREKDSIMEGIAKFNQSDSHKEFVRLNEERKSRSAAFYSEQDQVLQSFSILERPLRKYSHIGFEHEEIVLDYLNQPVETLANDKGLVILQVLKNLGLFLDENKLQIDEKKKEKYLEEVKRLNKEFIDGFLKQYYSFKADVEDLDAKIAATRVAEKLKDFNKQLEETNLSIEKSNEERNRLFDDAAKIKNSIANLKEEIESSIKGIFGQDLSIVI